MKRVRIAIILSFAAVALCMSTASAQRTYTFEEACRLAGQTTGACAPKSQQKAEHSDVCQRREHALGFHGDRAQVNRSAEIGDWTDMEVFVELMGGGGSAAVINQLGLVICREPGEGAAAYIEKTTNYRILAFDPAQARAINPESYLIIAHESGHHFCKHPLSEGSNKDRELEADRFAGAAIRRFEIYHGKRFLDGALQAASRLFSEGGRQGRPARSDRIAAIRQGYEEGSSCGNLPPATRGPGLYAR